MRVVAVSNAKGGTGKTTVAVHLAAGMAKAGHRTLLVDLDFQGNATEWLSGKKHQGESGSASVLENARAGKGDIWDVSKGVKLDLMPCSADIVRSEYAVIQQPVGQLNLRTALQGLRKQYDSVVLDCPPNLGVAAISGLCAADGVVVPMIPAFLSITGLRDLEQTVAKLRHGFKVPVQVLGYLLFAADPREGVTQAMQRLLGEKAKDKLFDAVVRVSTAAKRLPETHRTAWDAGADPRGAEDYVAVLEEVLERINRKRKAA